MKQQLIKIIIKTGRIGKYFLYKYIQFFKSVKLFAVYIETTNFCNLSCDYCPVSTMRKPKHLMNIELFYKIIDDLENAKYTGIVVLNGFGEPLSDERIFDLIKYTRKKLSNNTVIVFSNGELLTRKIFCSLIESGLSKLYVSMHNYIFKNERIKDKKIEYLNMSPTTGMKLTTRAGNVNIDSKRQIPQFNSCWCQSMFIDSYGIPRLCCNDYQVLNSYDSVEHQKVLDVWNNKRFTDDRNKVAAGIYELDICLKCIKSHTKEKKK